MSQPMNISDEELMAYLDGELDAGRRASIEGAIEADPDLARRVAEQQSLLGRLRGAFHPILDEPVPQRLTNATRGVSTLDMEAVRARQERRRFAARPWLAAAASLVLGVLIAPWITRPTHDAPDVVMRGASLSASGDLAAALTSQLSAEPSPSGRIRVVVSYVGDTGEYCRAFVARHEEKSMSGIACRSGDAWHIRSIDSGTEVQAGTTAYRQASSALSPLVRQAIESSMIGEPLDADAERAARGRGWTAPDHPASR